jgi:hypothetical protein
LLENREYIDLKRSGILKMLFASGSDKIRNRQNTRNTETPKTIASQGCGSGSALFLEAGSKLAIE